MLKKLLILIGLMFLLWPSFAHARDTSQITDWYIKDFQSEIVVNADSTATITEMITADCGNLPNKHGIFRVLPTQYMAGGKAIKTPVELISITDFNGLPYHYETSRNQYALTWKIGDANRTVQGVNYYKIIYKYKNVIQTDNPNFDQFYWNLLGNFWEIDIDSFNVTVKFPGSFEAKTLTIYSGTQGTLTNQQAQLRIIDSKTVDIQSVGTFKSRYGISLKADFPKGIFAPYQFTFMEKYGTYLWLIFPLIMVVLAVVLFLKYGRDPKINKTVVPEFAPPDNLDPMALGRIFNRNKSDSKLIAALLISLGIRGFIKFEDLGKKWALSDNDFKLTLLKTDYSGLEDYERALLSSFFTEQGSQEVILSKIRNKLSSPLQKTNKLAEKRLITNGYYEKTGQKLSAVIYILGVFVFVGLLYFPEFLVALNWMSVAWLFAFPISILYMILGAYMGKLTLKGAEVNHKTKGLKLYMDTAERYRQQFNEKENIFERFLPYAIMFGITKEWAKKISQIYGDEYLASYHPVWFAGTMATFNTNSFVSSMDSVASAVSSSASSGSGGGSGGAGGGGGGGGGGGW